MACATMRLVGFGEAMVRFAPMDSPHALADPTASVMLRSVGGDELNVTVAAARLMQPGDLAPQWVSVLPTGPLGDVVYASGTKAGVDMSLVHLVEDADVGIFTVVPELKAVHYQRRNGAFAQQAPNIFAWDKVLGSRSDTWLHMTGITPMISKQARLAWTQAMTAAQQKNIPVSVDFNHRKQLGTLDELWTIMLPFLSTVEIMIFSVGSLVELAEQENMHEHIPSTGTPLDDAAWRRLMAVLRARWGLRRLAVCFKSRDENGLQRRWSAVADGTGVHTSLHSPVFHVPKDECGGGSAWACGILDAFMNKMPATSSCTSVCSEDIVSSPLVEAIKQADLLAGNYKALCQETAGDHSQVTRAQLVCELVRIEEGKGINLETQSSTMQRVEETLEHLKIAGILPIIRAKNPDAAIARGVELYEMGCRAIEVTLDTVEWRRVLKELVAKLPPSVCIGVGTVMDCDVALLPEIAAMGARFALSPIEPIGFIDACHRIGVLAVPAGMTSNELWGMHRRGARLIKLFHATMVSPSVLKSMLGVTPLSAMNIAPSGGASPENAEEWWDAGAVCIGMGSNLTGKDIQAPAGTPAYESGKQNWEAKGRATAQTLFDKIKTRFPLPDRA